MRLRHSVTRVLVDVPDECGAILGSDWKPVTLQHGGGEEPSPRTETFMDGAGNGRERRVGDGLAVGTEHSR